MKNYLVVEKDNHLAIHCISWSRERAELWIEQCMDFGIFTDKTLNKSSFEIIERAAK